MDDIRRSYAPPGFFNPYDYQWAFVYGRRSKPNPLSRQSEDRQEAGGLEAAKQFGWTLLDRPFFDDGVSGGRGKNATIGELANVLRRVINGEFPPGTVLAIEALDRLTRQPLLQAQALLLNIVTRGVAVYCTGSEMGFDEPSLNGSMGPGLFFAAIAQMAGSHGVFDVMSKRGLKGWETRHERMTQVCPAHLTPRFRDDKDLKPGEKPLRPGEKPPVVGYDVKPGAEELFNRMCEDACIMGIDKVISRMNAGDQPPFESKNHHPKNHRPDGKAIWYDSHVKRLIKSRVLRGDKQVGKIEWVDAEMDVAGLKIKSKKPVRKLIRGRFVEGAYPEIISEDLQKRVIAAFKTKEKSRGRKGDRFPNLFQGLCRCAHCGEPEGCTMTYTNTIAPTGKSYERLRCANVRRGACGNRRYDYALVEREFLAFFQYVVAAYLRSAHPKTDPTKPLKAQIAKAESDLTKLEQAAKGIRDDLMAAALKGGRSEADVDEQMRLFGLADKAKALRASIPALQRDLEDMVRQIPSDIVARETEELVQTLADEKDQYLARAKINAQLRRFIHKVIFDRDGMMTVQFGYGGKQLPPAPSGVFSKWPPVYRMKFNRNGSVEREHPMYLLRPIAALRGNKLPANEMSEGFRNHRRLVRPTDTPDSYKNVLKGKRRE